ncbi:MAG TPA: serine protease [Candidatus Omnitrophica bacterium]|nr:MAG: hypothetical protein A2Z81_05755 [Omnitrophica WOR_2 bacterium GWA2_45_18]HBR14945.1 serine protease [Candidatus Omnitrophota bacterium]
MRKIVVLIGVVFWLGGAWEGNGRAAQITDEAQRIYQQHQKSVYQIQVVDLATEKKTAIGSGFQFTPAGYLATNYHVLSQAIHSPERFRVDYVRYDGVTGPLTILDVDVVHDLAVVQSKAPYEAYLSFSETELSKGTRIFSLGNPLDLGMTIIEGTYNGLMEKSLYRKILFSGSLNPGMSGGPALDHDGRVIGVNVSTAGNQVSFLVPVEYLRKLYEAVRGHPSAPVTDWNKHIEEQLIENQNNYMDILLSSSWDVLPVGEVRVSGEIMNVFKCWGSSEDKKEELYNYAYINCSTEDRIFLSDSHETGQIIYKYNWVTSKGLNPMRFYNLYENYFRYPQTYENAEEDDAGNFECHTDFVTVSQEAWKASLCARHYKKYPKLYDINLSMASVNKKDRGLLLEVVALGISREKAENFVKRFLKEIQWGK